jgi:hypothetical protein
MSANYNWNPEWLAKVTVCFMVGFFTLFCQETRGAVTTIMTGKDKRGEPVSSTRHWWNMGYQVAVIIPFFIAIAIYLCAGDEYVIDGGNFLSRENGFMAIIISYVILHLIDLSIHIGRGNSDISKTRNFTWWIVVMVLIQSTLGFLGMSIIATSYDPDHTNGAYGYAVFAWLWYALIKLCVFFAVLFWAKHFDVVDITK